MNPHYLNKVEVVLLHMIRAKERKIRQMEGGIQALRDALAVVRKFKS